MAANFARDPCSEQVVNVHQVPSLGPIRPVIEFPKSTFGRKELRFQERWYGSFDWLEYSIERDAAFCYYCRIFGTLGEYTEICLT